MRFQQDIFCSNLFFSSDQSDFDWGSRKEKNRLEFLCFSFLTLDGAEIATLLKLTMHLSETPPIDKTEKFKCLSLPNEKASGNYADICSDLTYLHTKRNLKTNSE